MPRTPSNRPSNVVRPPCFKSEADWKVWKRGANASGLTRANYYCTDCTPEYQRKMIAEGSCSWPQVTFHKRKTQSGTGLELIGTRFADC